MSDQSCNLLKSFLSNRRSIVQIQGKNSSEIEIGIDHPEYTHITKLASVTIKSLSADFI